MLVLPAKEHKRKHTEARNGMEHHFNRELEKILNENSSLDKYWIMGKISTEKKRGATIVRPFLQACMEKPGVVRETFVYEVDNRKGIKTLLWVMHPGDTLTFPTLGKSIRIAGSKGATILTPK